MNRQTMTIERSFCGYRMVQTSVYKYADGGATEDRVSVAVYDLSRLFPLVWSRTMTKEQAKGARALFEQIGYFDVF